MATCYSSSGAPVAELGPCNTTETISLCCTPGQICLTNGLCATQSGQFYTGACTDKTYNSEICPKFCTAATGTYIIQCENSPIGGVRDGDFCCESSGDQEGCCNTAARGLGLAPSASSADAVIPEIATASNTGASLSSSTSSAFILSTTSLTFTPTSDTRLSNATTKMGISPLTTTVSSAGPQSFVVKHPLEFGVGLGLGIPAVIVAKIAIWFWVFRHRNKATVSDNVSKSGEKSPRDSNIALPELHSQDIGPIELPANELPLASPALPAAPSQSEEEHTAELSTTNLPLATAKNPASDTR